MLSGRLLHFITFFMAISMSNLLTNMPTDPDRYTKEIVDILLQNHHAPVERIVSHGQITEAGQWYDQVEDEWVAIISGEAELLFEDGRILRMKTGDHVLIPAHQKHRVTWTPPDRATVWLAVFVPAS